MIEPAKYQEATGQLPFRPADMYLEATDQHRGWFQSSLMTSIALNDRAPYKACVTHGFVVDLDGKKISKSGTYDKPMDAGHFVGRHGADLVRLWASSIDYTADVPFSEEMFTRLGDTYRRIRNTLRILLGNFYDFKSGSQESMKDLTLIDRWILHRLTGVIVDCRRAYDDFQFHKVYQELNEFCAVDLSSLYIDITKDRMYCDAADSRRRRASQWAMHEIFEALCRLLAPILAFTAEEAWRHLGKGGSIHLEEFPEKRFSDSRADDQMAELRQMRSVVYREIEKARQEKVIGNSLEAAVVYHVPVGHLRDAWQGQESIVEEIMMVGSFRLEARTDEEHAHASVSRTPHKKCARCWRHRAYVGTSKEHPDLCDRCEKVVARVTSKVGST